MIVALTCKMLVLSHTLQLMLSQTKNRTAALAANLGGLALTFASFVDGSMHSRQL